MITARFGPTTLLLLAVATSPAIGQMSKRTQHRYDRARFERTAPALGSRAPGLTLTCA